MVCSQSKNEQEAKQKLPVIYEITTGAKAPTELRQLAIEYAQKLGLVPELGHVCLYHGKPRVTLDGWFYLFHKHFPKGRLISRPLNEEERHFLAIEGDLQAWRAEVYVEGTDNLLSVGYGVALAGEDPLAHKSAVEPNRPWRMAEEQAEEDAIRKVVPLNIENETGD